MKFFAIVALLCIQASLSLARDVNQKQTIRDIINEFIDSLKARIPEPVDLPGLTLNVPENEYISGYAVLTNGTLGGLGAFDVEVEYRGTIIPIPTGFTTTYRRLNLLELFVTGLGLADSESEIYYNVANVNIITTDLVLQGAVDFNLLGLNFTVTTLGFHVGGIEFQIEGILSERFSALLSRLLTDHVANVVNTLQDVISPILIDIINDRISGIFNETREYFESGVNALDGDDQDKSLEELRKFFEILGTRIAQSLEAK